LFCTGEDIGRVLAGVAFIRAAGSLAKPFAKVHLNEVLL
jgi:hypothetical protein